MEFSGVFILDFLIVIIKHMRVELFYNYLDQFEHLISAFNSEIASLNIY